MTFWRYRQQTGEIFDPAGKCWAVGYSGHCDGKNNASMQHIPCIGPIPRGFYDIGEPFDSDHHGPYCLRLTPFPENEMHGREGFLIHGDSKANPGMASLGCIVLQPAIRKAIWASDVHILEVTL